MSKRNSFVTIEGNRKSDGGGGAEDAAVAKRSTKGMRPGPGTKLSDSKTPAPFKAKNWSRGVNRTIASKGRSDGGGDALNEWCLGKRKGYK